MSETARRWTSELWRHEPNGDHSISEHDSQIAGALVSAGDTSLAVRSVVLVRRGLALAKSLEPDPATTHVDMGLALWERGDREGAIAQFRQAVRVNPKNELARYNLGLALWDRDLAGAAAEFREVLHLNPANGYAPHWLLEACWRKGDLDGAIRELSEGLRLNPSNVEAHLNLGLALWRKCDMDGAVAEFRQAVRLDPNSPPVHAGLGIALKDAGQPDAAIREFREAVRLDPDDASSHYQLAAALEDSNDLREALQEYRVAHELEPEDTEYNEAYERLDKLIAASEFAASGQHYESPLMPWGNSPPPFEKLSEEQLDHLVQQLLEADEVHARYRAKMTALFAERASQAKVADLNRKNGPDPSSKESR